MVTRTYHIFGTMYDGLLHITTIAVGGNYNTTILFCNCYLVRTHVRQKAVATSIYSTLDLPSISHPLLYNISIPLKSGH